MKKALPGKTIVKVDHAEAIPIYKQIVQSIREAITLGTLKQGGMLPSVNQVVADFSIARGSVFKAFNELRNAGIIDSVPGKGYFVSTSNLPADKNIFLMLSTFNPYREALYNAFVGELKDKATVDVYFHHHNIKVFETLVKNHAAYYNTFVIMPVAHPETADILLQLDQKKIFLLDTGLKDLGHKYPFVCQNYEQDINSFLTTHTQRLEKYKRVVFLFSANSRAYEAITGFESFFSDYKVPGIVVRNTLNFNFKKRDLYVTNDDNDLVNIIKQANRNKWVLGLDIGVISYNETPLKSIIAEGITTITSDYKKMGIDLAQMIISGKRESKENPFSIIDRHSF